MNTVDLYPLMNGSMVKLHTDLDETELLSMTSLESVMISDTVNLVITQQLKNGLEQGLYYCKVQVLEFPVKGGKNLFLPLHVGIAGPYDFKLGDGSTYSATGLEFALFRLQYIGLAIVNNALAEDKRTVNVMHHTIDVVKYQELLLLAREYFYTKGKALYNWI